MNINNAMSDHELRQQGETITAIDNKISGMNDKLSEFDNLVKRGRKLAPYGAAFFTFVGAIIGFTVRAVNWEQSIVKQPQFLAFEKRTISTDSILHEDHNTLNAKVDTFNVHLNKRIDKLPFLRVVNATQHKDKYGHITYNTAD